MSARIVAVTSLLLDVLANMDDGRERTESEAAFLKLLGTRAWELHKVNRLAMAEMQALAPAVLAADLASSALQGTA